MKTLKPTSIALLCLAALPCLANRVAAQDLAVAEEKAIHAATDRLSPSVVRIETIGSVDLLGKSGVAPGPSTGLVVGEEGYIVTSAFPLAGKPAQILVELPGGARSAATIVARDDSRQIVLLKVDLEKVDGIDKLIVPVAAPLAETQPGAWAIALGRTFPGEKPNVSVGIVSAVNRVWGKAVQTDAKISPANYGGPLVDIRGRVIGVLAPLSPTAKTATEGAQWYDSGIGFAVPLETINQVLPRLKQGENLKSGVMGITLRGKDQFAEPPIVGSVRPSTPAATAGLKAGDKIVAVNDRAVESQAQLKHVVSPLYAGDSVKLSVLRGKDPLDIEMELAGDLKAFKMPFIGILPVRDSKNLVIRAVWPDSPASQTNLKAGDQISKIGDQEVATRDEAIAALIAHGIDKPLKITLKRGDKELTPELKLAALPTDILETVAPDPAASAAVDDEVTRGEFDLKIAEFKNEAYAYVPENYNPDVPHGVVIWMHAPSSVQREATIKAWKEICEQRHLILLAPLARDVNEWAPDEAEFVKRAVERLREAYTLDNTRIVAHGYQGGGAMAYLVALVNRDTISAVAVVDSHPPAETRIPENDPAQPLAVLIASNTQGQPDRRAQATIKGFEVENYPVTQLKVSDADRYLDAGELKQLARWIDSLDRI